MLGMFYELTQSCLYPNFFHWGWLVSHGSQYIISAIINLPLLPLCCIKSGGILPRCIYIGTEQHSFNGQLWIKPVFTSSSHLCWLTHFQPLLLSGNTMLCLSAVVALWRHKKQQQKIAGGLLFFPDQCKATAACLPSLSSNKQLLHVQLI